MTDDQNCVATKVARENPMKNLQSRNEVKPSARAMPKTAGAVPSMRKAWPYLGPNVSHTTPIAIRQKIVPVTAAIPALPSSGLVRSRLFLMTGIIGAAAKVDRNDTKKLIHDKWKALMCGLANDRSLIFFALCSVSTGRSKAFPFRSLGTPSSATTAGFSPVFFSTFIFFFFSGRADKCDALRCSEPSLQPQRPVRSEGRRSCLSLSLFARRLAETLGAH
mmetsp:Transcript_4622/g.13775  ORF Transcript_4622/g.13775 Transcript_4622/m.13775 type:complete len:220 (-) Transcript_4622:23-682(-)